MRTVRVLIVDDQAPFRRAAAAVVDSLDGFAFVGAALDGESSPGAVARYEPDLALMDVNLPEVDGIEATRRIRALAGAPVVVLVSSSARDDFGDDLYGAAPPPTSPSPTSARTGSGRSGTRRGGEPNGSRSSMRALPSRSLSSSVPASAAARSWR